MRFLLLAGSLAVLAVVGLALAGFFFLRDRRLPARDPIRIEVIVRSPGSSPEEMERQVTIPLEVTLAGMEGLEVLRSKSGSGVTCVQAEFRDGFEYDKARQEIINRLQFVQGLPPGALPLLSPLGSPGEFYRYILTVPQNPLGQDIYTLADLRALQDWKLEREFRRVPRILDVSGVGGTLERYEIQPDPERLQRYSVNLASLEKAIADANANVGQPLDSTAGSLFVRGIGLFGGGLDPLEKASSMKSPEEASAWIRAEENSRIREIRNIVVASNKVAVRVDDLVVGGPLREGAVSKQGVVVASQARQGRVGISRARTDEQGNRVVDDRDDCVEGVIHLRHGEDARIAWRDVRVKIEELNTPGTVLPGVRLDPWLEGSSSVDYFWIRALLPMNVSEVQAVALARRARGVVREFPEVDRVVSEVGGSEDGCFLGGWYAGRLCVVLRAAREWPNAAGSNRPRTKAELMDAIAAGLEREAAEVGWDCLTQYRQDMSGEFAGSAEEAVLKIVGPDLEELEKLAGQAKERLEQVAGVRSVRILHAGGLPHLTWRIDANKCARWGVTAADVNTTLRCALEGKAISQLVEGEKTFDITLRWPAPMRRDREAILDIPLDIVNNQLVPVPGVSGAPPGGLVGQMPRMRLRDVLSPMGENGAPDEKGGVAGPGVAAIYRENGRRVLLLRIGVRGRAQAAVCAEGEQSIAPMLGAGYRLAWDCGR
jgi:Cu/Ag efflux pump CusA